MSGAPPGGHRCPDCPRARAATLEWVPAETSPHAALSRGHGWGIQREETRRGVRRWVGLWLRSLRDHDPGETLIWERGGHTLQQPG